MAKPDGDSFDYVIVGSGAAGSVLANRLSADPGATVCVLEAGPPDRNPFIHIPAGFIKTLANPAVTWQFKTEAIPMTGGRRISTTQGRTLGGSSSVNGMIYNRGQPTDLDSWAQRGNRGWGYADCLPYYRRGENRIGLSDDSRGRTDGAIPVTDMDWINQVSEAFIQGCEGIGIPRTRDYNSGDQAGVGYYQRTIHKGRRISAAVAFLKPAMARPNLSVRTNARASRILFEGKRAIGIEYLAGPGAPPRRVMARKEVILSAGTVNTARLLQVSGVGPAALLASLGVPVVHELRGVGANFRDHYASRFVMRAKPGVQTLNQLARGVSLGGQIARWATGRPSILATTPSHVHVFWKSFEGLDQPDLQCVFTPGSYAEGKVYVLDDYPGVTAGAWQHRPESTGWVRARSANVFEDPEINPNYLSDPMDIRVHLGGMRLLRRMLGTPELAQYLEAETLPGPKVQSDDELLDFAKKNGSTTYHLIGTARMGPETDPSAVVDDRLRVHGMQGLRVIDASIMPSMTSANTYATTLMIAERGADFIKGVEAA
ncbi:MULTISPECIES: GMC family oxidoreductase [Roseomonadaceae]|uniref:GMC family oxidoreductase N-terminal domain-containing protein n=1 Tax=Falsiroseomonas oleicola TaxID=2801474 RepID=A0ABS6HA52_9PROT|nr:GMC family oxidoreductase N-terminal domain-containing protein [Roseomonas oleicola]MBU8545596.1 GMC family oxidoreductase N-terminal domain-containing protein [Roseomonas oleicola]